MKRIILAIPVLIITLLAILIIAPSFIDWSVYKTKAQTQIKQLTGHDVELNGKLSFAFIPSPRVHIENVVVKAPEGSRVKNLAALERLEASLALMPLFSGDVKVSAVELVKPQIALEILSNEKPNWMTPELERLKAGKDVVPEDARKKAGSGAAQAISLDKVSIKDGSFAFTSAGKATEIENIDLDIKAETLKGPFEAEGELAFGGQPLKFNLTGGEIEEGAESLSIKADADYNGIKVNYAGVVAFGADQGLQGETQINIPSLAQAAKNFGAKDTPLSGESASLKGLLTASKDKLSFKNSTLMVGQNKFAADFSTQISPLYVAGTFKSADTFNLDKIMPPKKVAASGGVGGSGGGEASGNAATALSNALPETLSIPVPFGADIKFIMPSLVYNNQVFNDVELSVAKKDKSFQGKFVAAQIPGKGKIDFAADLTFAEKSISKKTGAQIYSGPSLAFTVKASTPDLPFTLQAITGKPAPLNFKNVSVDGKGYLKPGKIEVNDTALDLDGQKYTVSGALAGQKLLVNAGAMGGKVIVKGDVKNDMSLSNTIIQVTHPNLAKAIQQLSGAQAQNAMLAQKIDFYTKLDQEGRLYKLSDVKATLGATSVSGALSYDGGASKPTVTGDLSFGDLVLQSAPASKSAGKSGGSGGAAKTSSRWSTAPIDTVWMNLANVDFAVKANSIKYESWDLTKPNLQFKLKDGVLKIADLSSGLYSGSVALSGTAQPASGGGIAVALDTTMNSIQMEPLVKSVFGNKIIKGKGSISSKTSVKASGVSHAALINSLSGQGTASGSEIILEGIDLNRFARALSEESKAGDSLLHLWKGSTGGGSTAFDSLDGAFTIQNGVVNLSKMDLDGARGAIQTKGTVDLPAWTVQTAHTMIVKDREDVPPFTINISGSLDNPGQTFAQGAIQDYLQRKINRKVQKLLSDELSDKVGGELGGVIGGLLGGGNAPSQQAPANDNAPQQAEPAGGESTPSEAQPVQQQQAPQQPEEILNDAFQGLLKGLGN